MKKLFSFLLVIPLLSYGQTSLPLKDGKVFYEKIDSAAADKAELYNRCRMWFVNTFKSAKAALQMEDKESGIIMGKGFASLDIGNFLTGPLQSNIHFTINITVKDNKYRAQIYDIFVSSNNNEHITYTSEDLLKHPKMNKKKMERIDTTVIGVITGLSVAMNKKADSF